ncbi:MAG: hypothetical protein ACRC4M_04815 [Mycoplasma sp.]
MRKTNVFMSTICLLTGVGLVVGFTFLITKNNNQNNEKDNMYQTNLKNSDDNFDKKVLKKYTNETVSIQISLSGTTWYGTGWNLSQYSDGFSTYIATNLHVISPILEKEPWKIKSGYNFELLRIKEDQINWNKKYFDSGEIVLEKIVIDNNLYKSYQDFVILKINTPTKTIFGENKNMEVEWLDTTTEFEWLKEKIYNKEDLTYYVCGFPYKKNSTNNVNWTTIKYLNNIDENKPYFDTADNMIDTNEKNYIDNSLQLIFPELNVDGGSSGSLVSVKYEDTIMNIGIYWGIYKNEKNTWGGVDLFYANNYDFYGSSLNYNLLEI